MSIITIVGAGMMGTSIGFPARENGHELRLVGTPLDREIIEHARATGEHRTLKRKIPDGFKYYQIEQLSEALSGADALVGGVSSFGVDWFIDTVLPRIPESLPVLSITKGMMDDAQGRLVPYPHLYRDRTAPRALSLNAVGGPCTSYELADHDQTHVSFCGDDVETLRFLKSLFATDYYHISLSTDVVGVECAVAMKNAYALAVSLAVGLSEARDGQLHYNSQAALFGQSVLEMKRLLALVGAGEDNVMLGAGDLYVTIFGGRTRLIGTLLGRGMGFDEAMRTLEGVTLESVVIATRTARAVRRLIALGQVAASDYPLLLHVDEIINQGAPVNIPWAAFERETVRGG